MKIGVSESVFRRVIKLLREGKTVPLLKFYIDERLGRDDVITLKGGRHSTKVRIEDIREYIVNTRDISSIPGELRTVYDDRKLKNLIGNVRRIYVIFVRQVE